MSDCPCGGSRWDHQRLIDATSEAARLREENRSLRATLEEVTTPQDMPLWRRIAMQRREIRALHFWVDTYRRWWRKEVDARTEPTVQDHADGSATLFLPSLVVTHTPETTSR